MHKGALAAPPLSPVNPNGKEPMDRSSGKYQDVECFILETETDPEHPIQILRSMGFERWQAWFIHGQRQIISQLMDIEEKLENLK